VLHLHDGHNTFSFKYPENMADEDVPSERLPDSNKFEFEHLAHEKGTAQVHRADPGSIYITLQDGRNNPTFTLQHQSGSQWKIIPKKRLKKILPETTSTEEVNPASVLEGAVKEADAWDAASSISGKALDMGGDALGKGIQAVGQHPLLAAGGTLASALALNELSKHYRHKPIYDGLTDVIPQVATSYGAASLAHQAISPVMSGIMGGNYI
jgi:hypothetical protein